MFVTRCLLPSFADPICAPSRWRARSRSARASSPGEGGGEALPAVGKASFAQNNLISFEGTRPPPPPPGTRAAEFARGHRPRKHAGDPPSGPPSGTPQRDFKEQSEQSRAEQSRAEQSNAEQREQTILGWGRELHGRKQRRGWEGAEPALHHTVLSVARCLDRPVAAYTHLTFCTGHWGFSQRVLLDTPLLPTLSLSLSLSLSLLGLSLTWRRRVHGSLAGALSFSFSVSTCPP